MYNTAYFIEGPGSKVNKECISKLPVSTMRMLSEDCNITCKELKEIVLNLQRKCIQVHLFLKVSEILNVSAFTSFG